MKKHVLASLVSSALLSASISASPSMVFRIPIKEKLSSYSATTPLNHPWMDVNGHYDCQLWSPKESTVDYGRSFTQTRDCLQEQVRDVDVREHDPFSDSIRIVRTDQENRTISETESQPSVGTRRDWIAYDSTFTDWKDDGDSYSYSAWSPTAVAQTDNFTQTRGYEQPQSREEQKRQIDTVSGEIKNIGEPVNHTKDDPRTDNRAVAVNWTDWKDTQRTGHTAWLPANFTETAGFQQTREFGQHQIRDRFYTSKGAELSRTEENRVVSPLYEYRTVDVTKNAWSDTDRDTYSSWSPAPLSQTSDFTQTRSYTQNQKRTWIYNVDTDVLESRVETRGVAGKTESRTVTASWSGWSYHKNHSFSGYSPSTGSVCSGSSFTQTETYKRQEKRTISYNIGGTGPTEYRDIDESRTRPSTGTKNCWASASSQCSSWTIHSGADWSSFSPSIGSQTSNFSQSRSAANGQVRTCQEREYNSTTGKFRNNGDAYKEYRSGTDTRTIEVSYTDWDYIEMVDHTDWSPSRSNVCTTDSLTQEHKFRPRYKRERRYYAGKSLEKSSTEYKKGDWRTADRTVSGTKKCTVCAYTHGEYFWSQADFTSGGNWYTHIKLRWNGGHLVSSEKQYRRGSEPSSFSIGGYRYTRTNNQGGFVYYQDEWPMPKYEVCRTPE